MLRFAGLALILGCLLSPRARADDPFAPAPPSDTAPPPPQNSPAQPDDQFVPRSSDTDAAPPPLEHQPRAPHDLVSIDFNLAGQDYQEIITGGGKSSETGALPGFHAAWEHLFNQDFSLFASFDGWFGETTYNGTSTNVLSSGTPTYTPLTGPTNNRILHAELFAGYRVRDSLGGRWHAYGGLAFQDWLRDSRPTAGGYREQYDWAMIVVGIEYTFFHTMPWEISADVSGRWNVGGAIDARLSDLPGAGLTDIVTSLGMAFGVRVQMPVRLHLQLSEALPFGLSIEAIPFFEYLPIGQSPTTVSVSRATMEVLVGNEPSSNTFLAGLMVGPRFEF